MAQYYSVINPVDFGSEIIVNFQNQSVPKSNYNLRAGEHITGTQRTVVIDGVSTPVLAYDIAGVSTTYIPMTNLTPIDLSQGTTTTTTDTVNSSKNNGLMYIGIGAALVVLALVLFD